MSGPDARRAGDAAWAAGPDPRLWALVDAGILVSGELHLDLVLERIVAMACQVIRCRYGALGVIDESGTGLSNFVFFGLSEADRARIGDLPVGRGLIGALIEHPEPIRLADLTADPRSVGFPENHPPMRSFLGVPIRARGRVFGNLYLTEKEGGEFTEQDERMAVALATQAGVAVENARLYEGARRAEEAATRRLRELELVQEVGAALIGELEPNRVLRMIVQRARELVGADSALIMLNDADPDQMVVRVAVGERAGVLEGMRLPLEGSFGGLTMTTLESILVDDALDDPRARSPLAKASNARSVVLAPLAEGGQGIGALAVIRHEPNSFSEDDAFVVTRFANLGSLALQNARAAAAERQRSQMETELAESRVREQMRAERLRAVLRAQEDERRRIARELHDSFGQALASILLGLKIIEHEPTLEDAHARIADVRAVAASAAGEVRRIAFELRPTALDDMGLAVALERYAHDVEDRTGVPVTVSIGLGDGRLHPDVETVVYRVAQEALTNAVKSASAGSIDVVLSESGGNVRLIVRDDGRGFDPEGAERQGGLGLLGMSERASLVGGRLDIRSAAGEGTTVELDVPRSPSPEK